MSARKSLETMSGDYRRDSESIATKVWSLSQIGSKWNAMFEGHAVTSVDRTSFNFLFEVFFSNLPLQTFIYCVTDQPSITRSRRSVLNFKLSVLTFSRSMSCSMSIEQKLCEVKIFQLQSMLNAIRCIDQRSAFKNSRISCLALILKLKSPSTTVLYAKKSVAGGEIWRVICSFFQAIDKNQWLSG